MPETESKTTRIRVCADGRIGSPRIVQYELLDGPHKGRLLTCPPLVERDLDPRSLRAPTAQERCGGQWQGWEGLQRRSYPFRQVVHDQLAYAELCRSGAINNRRHTGAGRAEDNRAQAGV